MPSPPRATVRASQSSDFILRRILSNRVVQAIAIALFATSIHSIGFVYISLGDTIPAELLPISVLSEGDLDYDEFGQNPQNLPYFFAHRKGRVINFYPIVPGLLNVPAFWVGQKFGLDLHENRLWLTTWTCLGVTGASVGFTYLALSYFCAARSSALLLAMVYALGTVAWSVTSRCLWQHGPSLLFLTGAMVCLLSGRGPMARKPSLQKVVDALEMKRKSHWLPVAGLLLGLAVWNRPTNIVFAAPLAVYVLIHHTRQCIAFAVWALIPAGLMAGYSITYWGELSALGQGHRPGTSHGGHAVAGFSGPLWPGLIGNLFSPARGLFVFSPVLLLGLMYVPRSLRAKWSHPIMPFVLIGLIADVYLYSKWTVWWGGHSFAYRMLIETVPSMILLLAGAWETWIARRGWLQVIFWPLLAASMLCHFLGAHYYATSAWNYQPLNVDLHTERLWQLKDSELDRDFRAMLRDMEAR